VLDGVNFDVRTGETVCLLGPSGVGKSVLLKHINGLIAPDSGDVFVDDLHVNTLSRRELAKLRTRIGYVFQYGALFDSMSVAGNITLGITDEDMSADVAYVNKRVVDCLKMVNMPPEVADKFQRKLSGGNEKSGWELPGLLRASPHTCCMMSPHRAWTR